MMVSNPLSPGDGARSDDVRGLARAIALASRVPSPRPDPADQSLPGAPAARTERGTLPPDAGTGATQADARPAAAAIRKLVVRLAVALRVTCTLAAIVVAAVTAVPGIDSALVVASLAVAAIVTTAYAVTLLRWPGATWPVYADVALAAFLCVLQGRLLPDGLEAQGSTWIAATASVAIIGATLTLSAPAAPLCSIAVAGGWAMGSTLAGGPGAGLAFFVIMLIQAAMTMGIMRLIGRATRAADEALAERERVQYAAAVEAAQRLHERALRRTLHDTVLATLTMVGTGSITSGSRMLRSRAEDDLRVLVDLAAPAAPRPADLIRVDQRLEAAAARVRPLLDIAVDADECEVPQEIADAMVGAVNEALVNIAKHAEVDEATLTLRGTADEVTLEITDTGVGFEPARTGRHHYGLRESVVGRMTEVGGWARIRSSEGAGCTVTLGWHRV